MSTYIYPWIDLEFWDRVSKRVDDEYGHESPIARSMYIHMLIRANS
jgi:hypothetical protein